MRVKVRDAIGDALLGTYGASTEGLPLAGMAVMHVHTTDEDAIKRAFNPSLAVVPELSGATTGATAAEVPPLWSREDSERSGHERGRTPGGETRRAESSPACKLRLSHTLNLTAHIRRFMCFNQPLGRARAPQCTSSRPSSVARGRGAPSRSARS